MRNGLGLLRTIVRRPVLFVNFFRVVRLGGWAYAFTLAARKLGLTHYIPHPEPAVRVTHQTILTLRREVFKTVPYVIDLYRKKGDDPWQGRVAVHLHLYYRDMVDDCIRYMAHIPVRFDLFVSVPDKGPLESERKRFQKALPNLGQVVIEPVPNRGRDMAPLIVQFGQRLSEYDIIAHFHTKKSLHSGHHHGWFEALMEVLCGSPGGVDQILTLLVHQQGRVVYPAGNKVGYWDPSGWRDNLELARRLLLLDGLFDVDDFPFVEFSQGSMFWARAECLRPLLTLPLTFRDFPAEPIEPDGTLAHALERLILIYATSHEGRNYRLESPVLSQYQPEFYEESENFSEFIQDRETRILAVYHTDFYGFSTTHPSPDDPQSWQRVRYTTPLFEDHRQPHEPHADLVTYEPLRAIQELQRLATQIKRVGLAGLIIQEDHTKETGWHPLLQSLGDNPAIELNFCLCWDDDCPDDPASWLASAIRFFQSRVALFDDKRYLRVEGRPLLFVLGGWTAHRDTAMNHAWRRQWGPPQPFPWVMLGQTQESISSFLDGVDVTLDWFRAESNVSAAARIDQTLHTYWPLGGPVYDYGALGHQESVMTDIPRWPTWLPGWDPMARPGESFEVLFHARRPDQMQVVLESCWQSVQTLPPQQRVIVCQSWNDWAHGCHLEPDRRLGYAALNAIGRTLSRLAFDDYAAWPVAHPVHIEIRLSSRCMVRLEREPRTRELFFLSVKNATTTGCYRWSVHNIYLAEHWRQHGMLCNERAAGAVDFILEFDDPVAFTSDLILLLLKMAGRYRGFHVSATPGNDPEFLHESERLNFSIDFWQRTAVNIFPAGEWIGSKICPRAVYYRIEPSDPVLVTQQRVSTLVRYHRGGDIPSLHHALMSLLVQRDCRVQVWLVVQDFCADDSIALQTTLASWGWHEDCMPVVMGFVGSGGDQRATMLNETVRKIGSGYLTLLDYDDILFPGALAYCLNRLRGTSWRATFGRVYRTTIDVLSEQILSRERIYESGNTFHDHCRRNIAPLHSFMLCLDHFDVTTVAYIPNMKYLEDYYFTLQVLTEGEVDWDSLALNVYIGDYIHRTGEGKNTLALLDEERKAVLLQDEACRLCEKEIAELKDRLGLRVGLAGEDAEQGKGE